MNLQLFLKADNDIDDIEPTHDLGDIIESKATAKESFTRKKYSLSRSLTDSTGKKWRLCAGVAVFNSSNEILVGKRIGMQNAWQAPQGGVDDASEENGHLAETVSDAAARELYEKMGLVVGRDVVAEECCLSGEDGEIMDGVRYETEGTESWLTKSGFAGQELHWRIFRCADGPGDSDPISIYKLEGQNGTAAEFSCARWKPVDEVMDAMWVNMRPPYESLCKLMRVIKRRWNQRCAALDFTGTWSRDNSLSTGLRRALIARGLSHEKACIEAEAPYIQSWRRASSKKNETTWRVTTFNKDGTSVRRVLDYRVGTDGWDEKFSAGSVLLGCLPKEVVVRRRTIFLAEPDAYPDPIAHCTISRTLIGMEETRRYLKGDRLINRRTLWSSLGIVPKVVSTEVFVKVNAE
uniref:Nudix hydrolase domain-containing protein n=1 Tax=Corethron hystrix TaxID=216773 RepID=A0A7S1BI11_9STRA|mmetsp:Transcript_26263/g.60394  ORF Transcript_26263/g.60394 Transcript_26263/m.60394 type:complete len:407 (+) Transcript_26263:185-1405(+)